MNDAHQGRPSAAPRNIPSLDGLRAISIALVIFSHSWQNRGFPAWIPEFAVDHGFLGVQIFFIISGFLITTLLLEEQTNTGRISPGLFYARRSLRIFPPFYCFLAALLIARAIGLISFSSRDLWFAATYTMNYASSGTWVTGHTWSLAVEEQFYLVWPLILRLTGFARAFRFAATVAVGAPLTCLAVYVVNPDLGSRLTHFFPLVADSIAAGCVLSGVMPRLRASPTARRWLSAPAGWLALPLIMVLDLGRPHPRIHLAFTETALNICICYTLARYTEFPRSPVGRFLNHPAVAFVGKLSYSLYLWQQIFMNRFGTALVQTFPLNIAASLGCALISWQLIESPMAGLRRRLRPAPRALA